jgi:hypothetical protein
MVVFLLVAAGTGALPPAPALLHRSNARRAATLILSALIGHTAWQWSLDRLPALRYVRWPDIDPIALRWLLAALALLAIVTVVLWLSRTQLQRLQRPL